MAARFTAAANLGKHVLLASGFRDEFKQACVLNISKTGCPLEVEAAEYHPPIAEDANLIRVWATGRKGAAGKGPGAPDP